MSKPERSAIFISGYHTKVEAQSSFLINAIHDLEKEFEVLFLPALLELREAYASLFDSQQAEKNIFRKNEQQKLLWEVFQCLFGQGLHLEFENFLYALCDVESDRIGKTEQKEGGKQKDIEKAIQHVRTPTRFSGLLLSFFNRFLRTLSEDEFINLSAEAGRRKDLTVISAVERFVEREIEQLKIHFEN